MRLREVGLQLGFRTDPFSVVFYAIFIKHDFNPTYFVKQMGFSTKSTKTNLNYQSHMTKTSP